MSLKYKLIWWMVAVVTLAVVTMGFVSSYWTNHLFDQYVDRHFNYRSEQLQEILEFYYEDQGSWAGVEELLVTARPPHMMMGRRTNQSNRQIGLVGLLAPGDRLRLTDAKGNVMFDSMGERDQWGQVSLTPDRLALSSSLLVGKEVVGYLLWDTAQPTNVQSLEAAFLNSTFKTTLITGLLAGLVAAFVGAMVAGKLAAPLEVLTRAAGRYNRDRILEPVELSLGGDREVEQLAQAYNLMVNKLNQHQALRRRLMGDVAHELRTPLTILRCNLEAIAAGLMETNQENMALLEEEVMRLVGLVEDLQELSLIEEERLEFNLQEEDLLQVLRSTLDFFQGEATRDQSKLQLIGPAKAIAILDRRRLTQVMINLMGNALRHGGAGSNVTVQVSSKSNYWEIAVIDDGPGIPPENLPHVFERFYKGDKSRTRTATGEGQGGSGLGLAIAKGLIEGQGGQIWASNEPQGGARLAFTLPKAKSVNL